MFTKPLTKNGRCCHATVSQFVSSEFTVLCAVVSTVTIFKMKVIDYLSSRNNLNSTNSKLSLYSVGVLCGQHVSMCAEYKERI
jgi:hypothetical protein